MPRPHHPFNPLLLIPAAPVGQTFLSAVTPIALLLLSIPAPRAAADVSINLSTGLDASNVVIPTGGAADAHWSINGQPAQVVTPSTTQWWGGWKPNDAASAWIVRNAAEQGSGLGTYTRSFDLTGVDLSSVHIAGTWMLDDAGTLAVNGNTIQTQLWDGWQNPQTFSLSGSTFLLPGPNSITLTIANTDNFHEGVRLAATLTGTEVPEPPGMLLTVAAAAGVLARRRRRLADL